MTTASSSSTDIGRFAIGFDQRDRARLHALIDEVLDSERWTEATMTTRFEEAWAAYNGATAVATSSWAGGALAALHFANVKGETVLSPSNTFMATPLAAINAGATVSLSTATARTCACPSRTSRPRPRSTARRRPSWSTSGATSRSMSERIADYCRANGIFLIEDCAHAHGASWNGQRAGTFGDAGVYSLFATKTISTGEGGVLVSRSPDVIEHARAFRNYGKPDL